MEGRSVVVARRPEDELHFSPTKKMVGERNPDSVLFRLEELAPRHDRPASVELRLSNTVRGGGSGLIDLRQIIASGPVSLHDGVPAVPAVPAPEEARIEVPSEAAASSRSGSSVVAPSSSRHSMGHRGPSAWATVLLVLGGLVALGAAVLLFVTLR